MPGERVDERSPSTSATALGETEAAGAIGEAATWHSAEQPLAAGVGLRAGTEIGRYILLGRIGAGATGDVFAAYDRQLDRKVAIKLVRPEGSARFQASARARLVREAQALAKVLHPNVLTVHEVGTFGEHVFLVEEFVQGRDLGAWCKAERRDWREVVAVLRQAGEGVAAAHAARIVHRDIKPANILVGDDGRVRVADFGLARRAEAEGADDDDLAPAGGEEAALAATSVPGAVTAPLGGDVLASPLTEVGALVGTPLFMSPEQHLRLPADERSDQFSFAAVLYEALSGELPFVGARATLAELRAAVTAGEVRPPPARSAVPRWVWAVVLRALRPRPEERFPSMRALLDALGRDPAARRRRVVAVALPAALGLALVAVVGVLASRPASSGCDGGAARLAGVWDGPRRTAVERSFRATGAPFADGMWRAVARSLDAYAGAWAAMHRDACQAAARHEQSAELLDLRMACLGERLAELRSVTEVLVTADGKLVGRALDVAGGLAPLATCADVPALRAPLPPPRSEAARAAIAAARAESARAKVLERAGKYQDGLAAARAALEKARAAAYQPAVAEALYRRGALEEAAGEASAEATLSQALEEAVASRHGEVTSRAASLLAFLVGEKGGRFEESLRLGRLALAAAAAQGGNAELEASALNNLGSTLSTKGENDKALEHYRRALVLEEKALGPDHPDVAARIYNLGAALSAKGEHDRALEQFRHAHAIMEKALGPDHPDVGMALNALGAALRATGQHESALRELRRALAIRERALGPDHPGVGAILHNIGGALADGGDSAGALEHYRRALAVFAKALGPAHPHVALVHFSIGGVLATRGDLAGALEHHRRAVALWTKALGPDHVDVAQGLTGLGAVYRDQRDHPRALEHLRRALAIYDKQPGPKHPEAATTATDLGLTLLAAGRPDEAAAPLERALAICAAATCKPEVAPRTSFALARVLAALRRDRPRALALAEKARADFARAGQARQKELAEVESWLRAQPVRR